MNVFRLKVLTAAMMSMAAPVLAQDAAAQGGSLLPMLFSYAPILFIFVIFYILIIKPQNQAAKDHAALVKALKKGDVVLTDGGVIGEITAVKDTLVHVRVNHEDLVAVARGAVKKVLTGDEAKGWEPSAPAATKGKR